jgi:phage replication O-like protein O
MSMNGADIQVEQGNWAKVHNGILEQLAKARLDGREAKCLFFLLRMTYGKQQKQHDISLSLWAEGTNIDKRHVKPIIDKLIQRRIIYRVEGKQGRGNTAIYGFNKYFEQWDSEEKVPSAAPIEKVLHTVPFSEADVEEKVPSTVPEKVPSTVPIKERVAEAAATRPLPKPCVISEFVQAYQTIWGLTVASPYIGDEIKEWEHRVTLDGWRYALKECADTRNIGNWKYFRRILERLAREGYQPQQQAIPITATVDFALEELV